MTARQPEQWFGEEPYQVYHILAALFLTHLIAMGIGIYIGVMISV